MSHGYIVSSTPYLVTSRRPIYKHYPNTLNTNPNKEKSGMVNVIPGWPFGDSTLEELIQPVKTRKVRGSNGKVEIVPIGTTNIGEIFSTPLPKTQELTTADKAIADFKEWCDGWVG